MGVRTCINVMVRFVFMVVKVFGSKYLREPIVEDTKRHLAIGATESFPSMLGSVDCMRWQWQKWPIGLCGQYLGNTKDVTIRLSSGGIKILVDLTCQDLRTTSMCPSDLLFKRLCDGMSRPAITPSTGMTTPWGTTLLVVSIHSVPLLLRSYPILK